MLVENIISFFATRASTTNDELQDIREYQSGDAVRDINRKKTATHDTLMTNTYEWDGLLAGKVLFLMDWNMRKGLYQSQKKRYEELVKELTAHAQQAQLWLISTKIISQPPKPSECQWEKTVIISDFFRDKKDLRCFLQWCQKGTVRGVIPKLYTETGPFLHPLPIQYPHYFFQAE